MEEVQRRIKRGYISSSGIRAGSVISCRGILRLDPDAVPGDQLQQLPEILDVQQVDPEQLPGRGRGLQRLRRGSGRINTRAEAHRAEMRPRGEQQRDPLPGSVISCRRSSAGSGCGTR